MKSLLDNLLIECRKVLDEIGCWPKDTVGKAACAGICMAVVCLMAHFYPFTVEAFFAALLAGGVASIGADIDDCRARETKPMLTITMRKVIPKCHRGRNVAHPSGAR